MMLIPYIVAFQIGSLHIQSKEARPVTTIVETAPEIHTPVFNRDELNKIIQPMKPVEPIQAVEMAELVQVPEPTPIAPDRGSRAPAGWYARGWCTYGAWVMAPWVGRWKDAKTWDDMARAEGRKVSSTPIPGSVFVDNSGDYGHVGVVLAVDGSAITVRDMNYSAFGEWTTRKTSSLKYVYIYP